MEQIVEQGQIESFCDLKVGDTFYFKQVGSDGTVGKVVTGKPCED